MRQDTVGFPDVGSARPVFKLSGRRRAHCRHDVRVIRVHSVPTWRPTVRLHEGVCVCVGGGRAPPAAGARAQGCPKFRREDGVRRARQLRGMLCPRLRNDDETRKAGQGHGRCGTVRRQELVTGRAGTYRAGTGRCLTEYFGCEIDKLV